VHQHKRRHDRAPFVPARRLLAVASLRRALRARSGLTLVTSP